MSVKKDENELTLKEITHGKIEIRAPPSREEVLALRAKRVEARKKQEELVRQKRLEIEQQRLLQREKELAQKRQLAKSKKSNGKQTRKEKGPASVQDKKDHKERQPRMQQKPPTVDNKHEEKKVMPPRDQGNDMRQVQEAEQHQKADMRALDKQSSNRKHLMEHNKRKNDKPIINRSNGGDNKQNT